MLRALATMALISIASQATSNDLVRGRQVFITCQACHSENSGALGPSLKGIIGRKSAALATFRYSPPLARANLTWDARTLRAFLADPQSVVKGNRMPFAGFKDRRDREDLIAYLETLK